jgi:hypothetical protein
MATPRQRPEAARAPLEGLTAPSGATPEDPEAAAAAMAEQAENPPAGATATEEDFANSQEAAAVEPERDPTRCGNCGQPATQRTTNPGANVDYFCDACGAKAYPENTGQLERTGQPQVPPVPASPLDSGQSEDSGPIRLRDGSTVADPRLDRLIQFDPKSREFPMRAILREIAPKNYKPRSYTWKTDLHFDQGWNGSCVGHAWAHEMAARPVIIPGIDQPFAYWVYKTAQKYDAWSGDAYEGTSVLAGAKVLQKRPPAMPEGRGLMGSYHWIFGDMDELIQTLGYFGPVVLGTNWYDGMMDIDDDGFIHKTGLVAGGHAILIKGVSLPREAVRLHQSWGESWGDNGDCWLSFSDLEALLAEDGELCVPAHRKEWG